MISPEVKLKHPDKIIHEGEDCVILDGIDNIGEPTNFPNEYFVLIVKDKYYFITYISPEFYHDDKERALDMIYELHKEAKQEALSNGS